MASEPDGNADQKNESLRDQYYARVAPLFGNAFSGKSIALSGDERRFEIALLLARCGLLNFASENNEKLAAVLARLNPLEDRYRFIALHDADLLIAGPGSTGIPELKSRALRLSFPNTDETHFQIETFAPGESLAPVAERWLADPFDCIDAINRTAALARALLPGAPASADAAMLARFSKPVVRFGHARWPWWMNVSEGGASKPQTGATPRSIPSAGKRHGRVLIIGCGSIGSVAAERLAPHLESLVLCDPEPVAIENPVRQAFSVSDVGQLKAAALARRLAMTGVKTQAFFDTVASTPAAEQKFGEFVDHVNPDLVILSTGTAAEFACAKILRQRGIRHIAARCYARARYFEIIAVDGASGPCYHCLRDQLHTGAAPSLTPEQKARYDPDYRPGELNAEPASIIESGRCADVLSRIAVELLKGEPARAQWLRDTLQQERCCFLGANHAEFDDAGKWAYGIDAPGKVVTYGPEDLAVRAAGLKCEVCGRLQN